MFDIPRERPWNRDAESIPKEVLPPRGMLDVEERHGFLGLSRRVAKANAITDAGSYIGASDFCFVSGVAPNERYPRGAVALHSHDDFEAFDEYLG